MTKEELKKMLPAMKWFANGGSLWWYDELKKEWFKHNNEELVWYHKSNLCYIIEDKYFEERKQYALGEIIDCRIVDSANEKDWGKCTIPLWLDTYSYRVRKEPVYEWQWTFKMNDGEYFFCDSNSPEGYYTDKEARDNWTKFEPSRRIRT